MEFMVVFTPRHAGGEPPADFWDRELEEQEQARVLYGDGRLRQAWALDTADRGAVCLFEVESPEALRAAVETFPLVRLDYAEWQPFPLGPYPGFATPVLAGPGPGPAAP